MSYQKPVTKKKMLEDVYNICMIHVPEFLKEVGLDNLDDFIMSGDMSLRDFCNAVQKTMILLSEKNK